MNKRTLARARQMGLAPTSTMSDSRQEREYEHFERNKPKAMQERMRTQGYTLGSQRKRVKKHGYRIR
jgi:hypothetical protein